MALSNDLQKDHVCSYRCERDYCIVRQRNELWSITQPLFVLVSKMYPDEVSTLKQAVEKAASFIGDDDDADGELRALIKNALDNMQWD